MKSQLCALLVLVLVCGPMGAETVREEQAQKMRAEGLLETSPGSLSIADYLLSRGFDRGVRDVTGYSYLSKLLIQHTLNQAKLYPDLATEYKTSAVSMLFNLAANTWIGWEQGVGDIQEHHRKLGMAAARLNVELAAELDLPPSRRRNGYWMLGAHWIAARDYDAAVEAFKTSQRLARESGPGPEALMAQGWIHATHIISGLDERDELSHVQDKLLEHGKEGKFFANQYDAAIRVFGGKKNHSH